MTFRGRKNSRKWSNVSESTCNLVNALQTLPNFPPESYLHLIPARILTKSPLDKNILFKQAGHLSVDIEHNNCGKRTYISKTTLASHLTSKTMTASYPSSCP
jgi:hypothetical protein